MPTDDRWYLSRRGPKGERLPSKNHGRGKRWQIRHLDAAGESRNPLFERRADAEAFDLSARTGPAPETKTDQAETRTTFSEYAERWRQSRGISQALEEVAQSSVKTYFDVFNPS